MRSIQQAQAFEKTKQNKEEIDSDAMDALCEAIDEFNAQTVAHMQGLILLTGLHASSDLRASAAYALGEMDPIFAANAFNTILRENEEEQKGALGALTEMNLKATYPVAVAMNEAGGVVDFLLDFLAGGGPGRDRSSAASLLGSIGADLERVVPALEAAAASADDWVNQDAQWALEEIADR